MPNISIQLLCIPFVFCSCCYHILGDFQSTSTSDDLFQSHPTSFEYLIMATLFHIHSGIPSFRPSNKRKSVSERPVSSGQTSNKERIKRRGRKERMQKKTTTQTTTRIRQHTNERSVLGRSSSSSSLWWWFSSTVSRMQRQQPNQNKPLGRALVLRHPSWVREDRRNASTNNTLTAAGPGRWLFVRSR